MNLAKLKSLMSAVDLAKQCTYAVPYKVKFQGIGSRVISLVDMSTAHSTYICISTKQFHFLNLIYNDCMTFFYQVFASTSSKVIYIKSTALLATRAVTEPRVDL